MHVWRADLTTTVGEPPELLSEEERARAARFACERERRRWRSSRVKLRILLGAYLQIDPGKLRFSVSARGKPALLPETDTPSAEPSIFFNISHSHSLALFAFTTVGAVGVDVQLARPSGRRPLDEVTLAARAFGRGEARRLMELGASAREREFLRLWTRHEAKLKCVGSGIGAGPACTFEPWLNELEVGQRAGAAVATERPASELCYWEWSAPCAGWGGLSSPAETRRSR